MSQEPTSTEVAPPAPRGRQAVVIAGIIAVGVVFGAVVMALWYRSAFLAQPTPTALLVFEATPEFDGTSIVIEGLELPEPRRVVVTADGPMVFRFPLPAGTYSIRIVEKDKTILLEQQFTPVFESGYRPVRLQQLKELQTGKQR